MTASYDFTPAAQAITRGGLILYPTDTIWSVGCDATDPAAVASIRKLTQYQDRNESLVILVHSLAMLRQYVDAIHPRIETLLSYHRRPLTVLYRQGTKLAPNVMATGGNIAVRITQDPYCLDLLYHIDAPLVACPAHVANAPYPTHFGAVSSAMIQGVDYVERYRQRDKRYRQPAVMVKLNQRDELEFLRE